MATGNTIEARLRIAAQVQDAIRDLKALRQEILATGKATQAAAGGDAAGGKATGGAAQAQQEAAAVRSTAAERRRDRDAERAAAREAAVARREAARQATEERRKTEREARAANAARVREEQEAARRIRAATNSQAQAYRQLPAQITDITTSLASGMPVWLVAVQQGGQIRDSFGGIGAAARALLTLLTPLRVAVGGVALGLGGLALFAASGYAETDRLNKALAVTGNTAGTSAGQVNALAVTLAREYSTSVASVRENLLELLEAGQQTGITLEASARAVTAYRKVTGASAAEAVKFFSGQRDAVLDWATKTNRAYNFLTARQIDYIRTLQAQGRDGEAVRLVNEQLAATLTQRAVPAIGGLERAWNAVKTAVSNVLESYKALGRPETIDQQIANLAKKIQEITASRDSPLKSGKRRSTFDAEIAQAQAELDALNKLRATDQIRAAERAAEQQAEQERIKQDTKTFQDAIAGVELAGVQKRLAARLAALDREQAAIDLAGQRQLLSEQEIALRSNAIDEARLKAQAESVKRQIEIEKARKVEKPEDVLARQNAVTQLEAQLLNLQSQLTAAGEKAQQLLAGDATEQARAWEQAWRDASVKVRELAAENAAAAAGRIADPGERARRAAELASEQQQRELDAQRRALRLRIDLTLDPGQAAELQRQLDALTTEGNTRIGETQRRARFESLRQQLEQQSEVLALQEQEINGLVERGAITTEEAERRKLAARQAQVPVLEQILELLKAVADGASVTEQNQVKAAENSTRAWADFRTELGRAAEQQATQDLATTLTDIETGAKNGKEALLDMVRSFARAMLNLINQRIAERLVGQFSQYLGTFGNSGSGLGSVGGGNSGFVDYTPGTGATTASAGGPTKGIAGAGGGLTLNMPITLNGARGDDKQLAEATSDLRKRVRSVVDEWAVEQSRSGGLLARN